MSSKQILRNLFRLLELKLKRSLLLLSTLTKNWRTQDPAMESKRDYVRQRDKKSSSLSCESYFEETMEQVQWRSLQREILLQFLRNPRRDCKRDKKKRRNSSSNNRLSSSEQNHHLRQLRLRSQRVHVVFRRKKKARNDLHQSLKSLQEEADDRKESAKRKMGNPKELRDQDRVNLLRRSKLRMASKFQLRNQNDLLRVDQRRLL